MSPHPRLSTLIAIFVSATIAGGALLSAGQEPSTTPTAGLQPTPSRPDASAPPRPIPASDDELWIEAVPVLLWWAGADKPRLQVCTADLGPITDTPCPIEGAPAEVRSVQVECAWDCSALPMRQRVRLLGRRVDDRFVARTSEPIDAGSP